MLKRKIFSCYLIGEDALLIQCAEMLLSQGHRIIGVISKVPDVKEWVSKNKITWFDSLTTANNSMSTTAFDYLFSIINPHVIPNFVLRYPRKLAINYHDSLLPSYAGVHATSWAILNNEKTHGITWHTITDGIDKGDILKQAMVSIDEHETAQSLNLKCYQQAMITFGELINELANKNYQQFGQDLSKRNYYAFNHKPAGNGWINWNSSAEGIDRLYRALSFGYYPNRLSLPKFILNDEVFVIDKLQISEKNSEKPPGTLVKMSANKWQIATLTKDIYLLQISRLDRKPCTFNALTKHFSLVKNMCLPNPDLSSYQRLEKISKGFSKYEAFWVSELTRFKPVNLPFLSLSSFRINPKDVLFEKLYDFSFKPSECKKLLSLFSFKVSPELIFLTIWMVYLYRLNNQNNLGVFINHPEIFPDLKPFIASQLPFDISLNAEMNIEDALKAVVNHYTKIKDNMTYLLDIAHRYPQLCSDVFTSPVSVFLSNRNDCQTEFIIPHLNSAIIFIITSNAEFSLYVNKKLTKNHTYFLAALNNIKGHFEILINTIIQNKSQNIANLRMLTDKERKQLLIDWNQTSTAYPKHQTIPELFEKQVNATPQNIAVSCEGFSLTYKELNEKANSLSCYLQKKGLMAGMCVAISADPDLYFFIGILAILKCGGIYVPIDPSYPLHHIEFILGDCKPNIILINSRYKKNLKQMKNINDIQKNILSIEANKFFEQNENFTIASEILLTPKNPAYIMYTSGTTGTPKGVIVNHQAIIRLVKNTNYIQIKANDRIAQAANLCFDAATFEIWGALLNGAKLVVAPKYILLDIKSFREFLNNKAITILWLTSALFNQFVSTYASMFNKLTYLLVGGDVVNPEKIKLLKNCSEGAPRYILNGYGPTENTTFSTVYSIPMRISGKKSIPIGKPISNSTAYVLDNTLQPVPIGVAGELYVGGDGLSNGYLNKPELTQMNFIPNLFGTDNSKLYRTGDIVFWQPDGNLSYLGRKDMQVKVKGFRIELEAIQAQLAHYHLVNQCFVTTHQNVEQVKSLVAYIVPANGAEINLNEVRDFMEQQLPSYMVPNVFMLMEKLPLNLNGKINIEKLPAPDQHQKIMRTQFKPPVTKTEKKLVQLWSTFFPDVKIGIDDSFFDLGGYSLLLTKLILELEENFNFKLVLYDFLEYPTIMHLAKLISQNKKPIRSIDRFAGNLVKDSILDPKISSSHLSRSNIYSGAVLLTGATGFLGCHLLHDLYRLTKNKIFCLIRAKTLEEAKIRLKQALSKYCLSVELSDRIIPVIGNLSEPQLGLSSSDFLMLAKEVDAIFHNGAQVHHLYTYEMLRAPNVLGTVELLKLATTSRLKEFHYISTLSAVSKYLDKNGMIKEEFVPCGFNASVITDGYSQTKLVSEQLLTQAHQRKIPVHIYRPGWILGQSDTGIFWAENNHLFLLLKGCIQFGCAPKWNAKLNILPVNFVSKFIVETAYCDKINKTIFNMINPYSLTWIDLVKFMDKLGYAMKMVTDSIWKKKYLSKTHKDNAIFNLLSIYINSNSLDWLSELDAICNGNDINTRDALEKIKLSYPKITENILNRYIKFLQGKAFLEVM